MKLRKYIVLSLLITFSGGYIQAANSDTADGKEKVVSAEQENFNEFLEKFTSSAAFQYSRVKFPLKSPIVLFNDETEDEREIDFSHEKWPLLGPEIFKEERITLEEGGTYISGYVVNDAEYKEFEAGYEESEIDLRITFELIEGEWYVTDCYTSWYADLPESELEQTVLLVQEDNKPFLESYP